MSAPRIAARIGGGLVPLAVAVAVLAGHGSGGSHASARARPSGPEGVPIPHGPPLAPPAAPRPGQVVDGISSAPSEQFVLHIHAHLTVFVAGRARQIPAGIGIAGPRGVAGFSWLHTHAADGIVHIESPVQRTFTLGELFDVWGQPLGPDRVGPASGPVTAFAGNRPYPGNPRDIPLTAHAQVQLDVGRPRVAPSSIAFPPGL